MQINFNIYSVYVNDCTDERAEEIKLKMRCDMK